MLVKIKLKINKDLRGFKAGAIVTVPLDRYWRSRLEDAKIDNCVEIVKNSQKKKGVNNGNNNSK